MSLQPLLTFQILLALMTQYERVKGAQSTAVPFFFWLLTAGCNLIPFYTIIIEQVSIVSVVPQHDWFRISQRERATTSRQQADWASVENPSYNSAIV